MQSAYRSGRRVSPAVCFVFYGAAEGECREAKFWKGKKNITLPALHPTVVEGAKAVKKTILRCGDNIKM